MILASGEGTRYTRSIAVETARAYVHYLQAPAASAIFKYTSPSGGVRMVGGRGAGYPSVKMFIYACGAMHKSVDLQSPCDKQSFKMMTKQYAKTHIVTKDAANFDVALARSQ
jgi:hypothetical protein